MANEGVMPIINTILLAYKEIPPITRSYASACLVTTILTQIQVVSPFQLYFNPTLIVRKCQIWRLFTTFTYFGKFGWHFLLNMIFTFRYCQMLEEDSFRGHTADFVVMFMFGGCLMVLFAFLTNIHILFLGQAITLMLVYVWSRRNPMVRMNIFGLANFNAPYLPWVILGFSLLFGNSVSEDLLGIAVGHIYYFIEDVYPFQPRGRRLLKTPAFLQTILDAVPEDPSYHPEPEDRPGGFNWGVQAEHGRGNVE